MHFENFWLKISCCFNISYIFSWFFVVYLPSHVLLFTTGECNIPGSSFLHYLWEFAQIHVHWVGDAIQSSHPLPHASPFVFNLSQQQGLFPRVSPFHQEAKVLELQLQPQSFQWIFKVISFRIDRCDLAVQGALESLLQYHNLKASILWHSTFFMV